MNVYIEQSSLRLKPRAKSRCGGATSPSRTRAGPSPGAMWTPQAASPPAAPSAAELRQQLGHESLAELRAAVRKEEVMEAALLWSADALEAERGALGAQAERLRCDEEGQLERALGSERRAAAVASEGRAELEACRSEVGAEGFAVRVLLQELRASEAAEGRLCAEFARRELSHLLRELGYRAGTAPDLRGFALSLSQPSLGRERHRLGSGDPPTSASAAPPYAPARLRGPAVAEVTQPCASPARGTPRSAAVVPEAQARAAASAEARTEAIRVAELTAAGVAAATPQGGVGRRSRWGATKRSVECAVWILDMDSGPSDWVVCAQNWDLWKRDIYIYIYI